MPLTNVGLQNLALDLISALQILPASRILNSSGGSKSLFGDLSRLNTAVYSNDFDIERVIPLLNAVLTNEPDEVIWNKVYAAVTESTPPPRPLPYLAQTPYLHTTSSFVSSSEHRKYVDDVLNSPLRNTLYSSPILRLPPEMPRFLQVELNELRKAFNPSPIGLFLIISDLDRLAMARRRDASCT